MISVDCFFLSSSIAFLGFPSTSAKADCPFLANFCVTFAGTLGKLVSFFLSHRFGDDAVFSEVEEQLLFDDDECSGFSIV